MSIRLHVMVGIILNPQGEVLVTQRQAHQDFAGLWEFPGGKREPHESAFEALSRELHEELGIVVRDAASWIEINHDYAHRSVLLDVWQVHAFEGEPQSRESQCMNWLSISALRKSDFPDANAAIVDHLRS